MDKENLFFEDVFTMFPEDGDIEDVEEFDEALESIEDESVADVDVDNTDGYSMYIQEISKRCTPGITPAESVELGRIVATGTKEEAAAAKKELVERHMLRALRYVLFFLRKHNLQINNHDKMDLIQTCNMSMINAVDTYDYTMGVAFSTHVDWALFHACTKYFASHCSRVFNISEANFMRYMYLKNYIDSHNINSITIQTIHDVFDGTKFECKEKTYIQFLKWYTAFLQEVSMDTSVFENAVEAADPSDLIDVVSKEDEKDRLYKAMNAVLTPREQRVLIDYYSGYSHEEIAKNVGYAARQSSIHAVRKAQEKLRKVLKPEDFPILYPSN